MIEIVLISLIVIISIPVLLYPFAENVEWEKNTLINDGKDFASISDKIPDGQESFMQNIMEKNRTEIINEFKDIIGNRSKTINYGMLTRGAIKNTIRVGFNCTSVGCNETMKNYLRNILRPTYVNGRLISFDIIDFSFNDLENYDIDVIFLNDTEQMNISDDYINQVKDFLSDGGGIVEFVSTKDVVQNWDNGHKQLQPDIFGVSPGSGGGTGDMVFKNHNNPRNPNYAIQKYFYGVGAYVEFNVSGYGNLTLWEENHPVKINAGYASVDVDTDLSTPGFESTNLGEGDQFSIDYNSKTHSFSVEKIDDSCEYVIINFLREPNLYEFKEVSLNPPITPNDGNENRTVLECTGGRDALIINENYGKAAWVVYGEGDDFNALLKSSIMWAAEDKWWNILKTISGEQTKVSYFVSQGEEFNEPYWVEINLWYVY